MTAVPRRFAGLVLSISVAAASVGLTATAEAAPGDGDVTITESDDRIAYVDEGLASEPTDTVRGTLRVAFVERRTTSGSTDVDLSFAIVTAEGDNVPIELAEDLPTTAANGAIEAEVVDDGSAAPQVIEAVVEVAPDAQRAARAGPSHRAYIATVSKTGAFASAASITTNYESSILREWVTESGGAITDFTVAGNKALPATSTKQSVAALCAMDDPDITWTAAERLFPGVSFDDDSGNHLIVLNSSKCNAQPWVGIGVGTVGSSIDSGGWLSVLADRAVEKSTAVHELGHNFGLLHANAKLCASFTCGSEEYHDIYSVMGFSVEGTDPPALDAIFRDDLGITGDGEVTVLTDNEPVETRLAARGSASGTRAIEVIDPLVGEPFWIEYRDGTVRDTGSAYAGPTAFEIDRFRFQPGVTHHTARSGRVDRPRGPSARCELGRGAGAGRLLVLTLGGCGRHGGRGRRRWERHVSSDRHRLGPARLQHRGGQRRGPGGRRGNC